MPSVSVRLSKSQVDDLIAMCQLGVGALNQLADAESFVVYVEIKKEDTLEISSETNTLTEVKEERDWIDLDWKNWDFFDFLSIFGVIFVVIGFVFALLPAIRAGGVLFPIGLGLMAFAAYGAQRRDVTPV
jgi:hypothetical protein